MIENLSSQDVQSFIRQHECDDVSKLILSQSSVHGIPMALIAEQIVGRKKAQEKLPTYYSTNGVIYPRGINFEQCSSESTGRFKSELTSSLTEQKDTCLDLTGGFGVDSFFFSTVFRRVCYVEPDKNLLEIACHNHKVLSATGILYINTRAEDYLASTDQDFDLVYIDPSRRASDNKKVFTFSECEPDVTKLLTTIFSRTKHLLIKASPLLDIQQGLRSLTFVKRILVIAVENECKELVFFCEKNFVGEPVIDAINLCRGKDAERLSFKTSEESFITSEYSNPLSYLYEPNAAILKAGAFKTVAQKLNVKKIHPHTHLYTSDTIYSDFPGRIFKVLASVKPTSKSVGNYFPEGKANVTTRNYPSTVNEIRNRTGLKDGGNNYLIGFSGIEKKYLLVASRIS